MRECLREMFVAILPALDPARALRARLHIEDKALLIDARRLPLSAFTGVCVLALGKAAVPMAEAAVAILGAAPALRVTGLAIAPHDAQGQAPAPVRTLGAGHPLPDAGSLHAADAAFALLAGATAGDLVLFLLSGGGSALCERPLRADIPLADVQAFHRALVTSGLDIVAMNALRKHASASKGGRLARAAGTAGAQITCLLSDVPGVHYDAVASGPSMPDASTCAQCRALLQQNDLGARLPRSYRDLLLDPALPETPKAGDVIFARSSFHRLLGLEDALDALHARATALGWRTEIDLTLDDAPLTLAVARLLQRLHALKARAPDRTVAVLSGGELSCPVENPGTGGRNQQFALACARSIANQPITVLSAGTDGIDGNSPAAGAVADGTTCARARARGLDPDHALARFDVFPLFAALGDAIVTGPTGTNVRDVRMLVM